MSTTLVSPRKNATAANGHGRKNPGNGGGGIVAHDRHIEDRRDGGDDDREAADANGRRHPWRCDEAPAIAWPVRSIEAWVRVLAGGCAIVTWCGWPAGAAPVSGVCCADALAQRSYPCQDDMRKSGPEGPLFMSARRDRERSSWAQSQR